MTSVPFDHEQCSGGKANGFRALAGMVFAMARNYFHMAAVLDMNWAQWALPREDQSAGQEIGLMKNRL